MQHRQIKITHPTIIIIVKSCEKLFFLLNVGHTLKGVYLHAFFRIDTMTQFTESIGKKSFFMLQREKQKSYVLKGQSEAMDKILKTYFLIKNQLSYRSNLSNGLFFRIHKYFFQSYIYVFSVCL